MVFVSGVSPIGVAGQAGAVAKSEGAKTRTLFGGGGAAFLVGQEEGTVQALDPVTLQPRGRKHTLGHSIGHAVVDPEGTLWAPLEAAGEVVPLRGGAIGEPIKVADPGHPLRLTLVNGRVAVTDPVAPALTMISLAGAETPFALPAVVHQAGADGLLVPDWTEGPSVPMLVITGESSLVVTDVGSGVPRTFPVGAIQGHRLSAPVMVGNVLCITDGDKRSMFLMDVRTGEKGEIPQVAERNVGPLPLIARFGVCWADWAHGAGDYVPRDAGPR